MDIILGNTNIRLMTGGNEKGAVKAKQKKQHRESGENKIKEMLKAHLAYSHIEQQQSNN